MNVNDYEKIQFLVHRMEKTLNTGEVSWRNDEESFKLVITYKFTVDDFSYEEHISVSYRQINWGTPINDLADRFARYFIEDAIEKMEAKGRRNEKSRNPNNHGILQRGSEEGDPLQCGQ